jgi:hypothetical protein
MRIIHVAHVMIRSNIGIEKALEMGLRQMTTLLVNGTTVYGNRMTAVKLDGRGVSRLEDGSLSTFQGVTASVGCYCQCRVSSHVHTVKVISN